MSFLALWFLILTFSLLCWRDEAGEIIAAIISKFRK